MTLPRFHTVEEVAAMLGHGPDWVWAQCRNGTIAHHKLGRSYRFTDDDVAHLAAQTAVPVTVPEPDVNPVPSKERARLQRLNAPCVPPSRSRG